VFKNWRSFCIFFLMKDNLCDFIFLKHKLNCGQVVPYLGRIDAEWEHMTRCIIEGLRMVAPEMTYEASLMYLCWVLDVKTPSLSASISFQHHLRFKGMRLVLTKIIRMPGQRQFGCWLIRRRVCKANAASEKWLTRAKTRAEAYPSTIKIRQ